MRNRVQGFSFIEVLTVLAMTAVMSAIAWPSFEAQLCKTRRADALVAVAKIQGAQERLRSRGSRYGDLNEIGSPVASAAGHYTLQMTAFDADGYELQVVARGAQSHDADCRYLVVRAVGMNLSHASGGNADVANGASANQRCWSL